MWSGVSRNVTPCGRRTSGAPSAVTVDGSLRALSPASMKVPVQYARNGRRVNPADAFKAGRTTTGQARSCTRIEARWRTDSSAARLQRRHLARPDRLVAEVD